MYKITKTIHFCYGHRILRHRGKCRHLHGHNGAAEVELTSKKLNSKGMVMDFEEIKDVIKKWIDRNLDHRVLLHEEDPFATYFKKKKEPIYLFDCEPTAENIARVIFETAAKKGLPVTRVTLWETPSSSATYTGK